jgi:hypothetical protein
MSALVGPLCCGFIPVLDKFLFADDAPRMRRSALLRHPKSLAPNASRKGEILDNVPGQGWVGYDVPSQKKKKEIKVKKE